jgi:hypothetical protein
MFLATLVEATEAPTALGHRPLAWRNGAPLRFGSIIRAATVILGSLAITLWYALARGQDFNWDQTNYHLSMPFLLAHQTYWSSIAPSGIQSYFNPTVLQLEYFGLTRLNPVVFVIILAALQSTTFMIAGFICLDVAGSARGQPIDGDARRVWLGLLGFALCLMAPMALSEAGTTFIDLVTAVPVAAAYGLLLVRDRWLNAAIAALLAGALIGLAAALKLTNVVFALGVAGFALAGPDRPRQRLKWVVLCGVSAILAFLAAGGSWQFAVWQRFGNPFFPYYNNIFHSPDVPSAALRDGRFLPHSVLDVWRYPLYWLLGGSPTSATASPSSELHLADARWAVVTFGTVAFLGALALLPRWRRDRLAEPATGLFFAIVIGYLAWLTEFGIHRYMAPLDVLCGTAVLYLAMQIRLPRLGLGLLAGIAIVSWKVLAVPDWGHWPWKGRWQGVDPSPRDFGRASIVFLTDKPIAYVAASFPADARYVGVYGDFDLRSNNSTGLTRQLKQELAGSPDARLKEVDRGSTPEASAAILTSYGLTVTPNCQQLRMPDETLRVCDVERTP